MLARTYLVPECAHGIECAVRTYKEMAAKLCHEMDNENGIFKWFYFVLDCFRDV